jgi:hypothetical protein
VDAAELRRFGARSPSFDWRARPFTVNFTATLGRLDSEILEYICIENNQYGLPGGYSPDIAK